MVVLTCRSADARFRWIVDAYPAAFVVQPNAANYEITSNNRADQLSTVSTFPNIATGAGVELSDFRLDLLAGAGFLLNGRLSSLGLYLSGSLMYEIARSARIGPRLGILYFAGPEWTSGDLTVKYGDAAAYMAGINMEMGDKISYILGADLWSGSFKSGDPQGSYVASDSKLDLSGIALEFGIRGRF